MMIGLDMKLLADMGISPKIGLMPERRLNNARD